jgi:iron(III) transport system ATP-binding protein
MINALECHALHKSFGGQAAVRDVTLAVRSGKLTALLGPSGCGKTTLLRLVAGFEIPDQGTITIKGRVVAGNGQYVPSEARRVGMVFQEYALFPHLSVIDNVAFGLRGSATKKQARAAEVLSLVGLDGFAARMPHELSGGQQQRVALARALAPRPDVMLLDEPFSNLDAALRTQVRAEVRSILLTAGTTAIIVTHDQQEALSLADEVAVMIDGMIHQIAPPQALYLAPKTRAVAGFIGEANFVPGRAEGGIVRCTLGELPITTTLHEAVEVLIRPEAVFLEAQPVIGTTPLARILWREYYGHDQRVGVALDDGTRLVARLDAGQRFEIGQSVGVYISTPLQVFPVGG